jgi:hypothetical protein
MLAGCGGPLSLLTGGGPNVAANVQAGAENRQALVSQENAAPSVSIRPNSRTGDIRQEQNDTRADTIQTYNAGIPAIYWIAWAMSFFIALWLDSPRRWPGQIMAAFKRKA